jgi:hypothetical protein
MPASPNSRHNSCRLAGDGFEFAKLRVATAPKMSSLDKAVLVIAAGAVSQELIRAVAIGVQRWAL